MRGSGALRTGVTPGGALAGLWVQNSLWTAARAVPSLDLRFADNKSLVDAVTGASLVTFTRASSGTFVGSDGVIRTAVTNLLLRSEEFDNASWNVAPSILTVTANTQAAPNETLTADTITTVSGTSALFQTVACVASTVYTWSFYVKLGTMAATDFRFAVRDDSNGAFIAAEIVPNVTPVTTEWRRVTYTFTTPVGCVVVRPYPYRASPATYGTTAFIWGAQLEQASTVGEYIPTTSTINSAPRFDHNPTTGESLGLLVEEQRTNLLLQSENFGTTWTTTGLLAFGSGSTLNATVAPDGQTTADLLTENSSTSEHRVETAAISWVANTTYTLTIFAKANGRTRIDFFGVGGGNFTGGREADFNLSTGSVIGTDGSIASITPFPNSWYRLRMTFTTSAAPSASSIFIRLNDDSSNISYTGNGTSGLFLWGAQLEAGAFPTSYIPTTTAAVTRAADVASITGSAFSSWYSQSEGTVFAEASSYTGSAAVSRVVVSIDGAAGDVHRIFRQSDLQPVTQTLVSNTSQATFGFGATWSTAALRRISYAYAVNNFGASIDGGTAQTDVSGTLPTTSTLSIGATSGNNQFGGTIKRLTFWPTRLSNSTLQAVTQ